MTRRGPGTNSAAKPARTKPTPNTMDDDPGPPGRNKMTSRALRCASVGPTRPGSSHSSAGSRRSRMAQGTMSPNDSRVAVHNFTRAERSRTNVAVATAATTTPTNHSIGTKAINTSNSNVDAKTRLHVAGRPRPTRGAHTYATHGIRTMATAEPIRPPETAPVTAGSVAYAMAAQTRAHHVSRSRRDAKYIDSPAMGMHNSKMTSTATDAEPRIAPATTVKPRSHVGASAADPVPTWCQASVNVAHKSPAPGGAGSSAPPRSTPAPSSARSPVSATTRRISPTKVPGWRRNRWTRDGRRSSEYQPSGSSDVDSRTERPESSVSRPANRSAPRSHTMRACIPRGAKRARTSDSGTADGIAAACATRARDLRKPPRSRTASRKAPHSSRA